MNQGTNKLSATDKVPPEIDISVQDPRWETIPNVEKLVEKAVITTLNSTPLPREALDKDLEISVVLANDDLMQVLNREYREKDKPTNVLTFAALDSEMPMAGDELNLGDIILSYQTIEREAKEQGKYLTDHLVHLTVHGMLHLLMYDHQTEDEANTMETLEIRILERLSVQNPYIENTY